MDINTWMTIMFKVILVMIVFTICVVVLSV
jgi:hypothetical protein